MDPISLRIRLLPGRYAVARPETWPDWLPATGWVSVTRTAHEISVVCKEQLLPPGILQETGFRALEFEGRFPSTPSPEPASASSRYLLTTPTTSW